MCTAVSLSAGGHYFGRTLDLEHHYSESVTVMPRGFGLPFRHMPPLERHYAVIGMASVCDGYPLYYDAVNEKGLCMAGLNFPQSARYFPETKGACSVAPFELIPWLLGQCDSVAQAKELLSTASILNEAFSDSLPLTPLHWMIADGRECAVVESVAEGLRVYDDPVGVLTNEPPFPLQQHGLNNYIHLSSAPAVSRFAADVELNAYSRGMGALGLPGDWSSQSRFVRAAFARCNSLCGASEEEAVNQFFHILDTVAVPRGCVRLEDGCVTTVYSSCCSANRGIYYYSTYADRRIVGVDMHRENLDGSELVSYAVEYNARLDH